MALFGVSSPPVATQLCPLCEQPRSGATEGQGSATGGFSSFMMPQSTSLATATDASKTTWAGGNSCPVCKGPVSRLMVPSGDVSSRMDREAILSHLIFLRCAYDPDPSNPQSAFRAMLWKSAPPDTVPARQTALQVAYPGVSDCHWNDAAKRNPDPAKLVATPVSSWEELQKEIEARRAILGPVSDLLRGPRSGSAEAATRGTKDGSTAASGVMLTPGGESVTAAATPNPTVSLAAGGTTTTAANGPRSMPSDLARVEKCWIDHCATLTALCHRQRAATTAIAAAVASLSTHSDVPTGLHPGASNTGMPPGLAELRSLRDSLGPSEAATQQVAAAHVAFEAVDQARATVRGTGPEGDSGLGPEQLPGVRALKRRVAALTAAVANLEALADQDLALLARFSSNQKVLQPRRF